MNRSLRKGYSYPTIRYLPKEASGVNLLNSKIYLLPDPILKKIIKYLPYHTIVKSRSVCRWFFYICGSILNEDFLNLMPRILAKIVVIERSRSMREAKKKTCLRILNIVECEIKVIEATCLEHISNAMCYFTGGIIMDYVNLILKNVPTQDCSELVSKLILLNDDFLYSYDNFTEPFIINQTSYLPFSWFGRKFINLLDCYATFNQNITLFRQVSKRKHHCKLQGNYEATKLFCIKTPPKFDNGIQEETSMLKLLEYLRNQIRWNNVLNFQLSDNIDGFNEEPKESLDTSKIIFTRKLKTNAHCSGDSLTVSFHLSCHSSLAPMKCQKYLIEETDHIPNDSMEIISLNDNDYNFYGNIKLIFSEGSHSRIVTYEITQSESKCFLNTEVLRNKA